MTDTNFQPIFDYIDKSFKLIKDDLFTGLATEIREIKLALDTLSAQVTKYHKQIQTINNNRFARRA